MLPARMIAPAYGTLARAGLPAARQAARRILAAGGRLLGGGAAIAGAGAAAAGGGMLAERAMRGPRRRAVSYAMPGRRRRAKGITACELRGARKVANLVRMYGMRPKVGRISRPRRTR